MSTELPAAPQVHFSHVHCYVDKLESVDYYKKQESNYNEFLKQVVSEGILAGDSKHGFSDVPKARELWTKISGTAPKPEEFVSQRDFVSQLIAGPGWRIVGAHDGTRGVRSLVIAAGPTDGAQFLVSERSAENKCEDMLNHFNPAKIENFMSCHAGRQGISVLGFEVGEGGVEKIRARYEKLHPKLLTTEGITSYADDFKVLEVYAYYKGEVSVSDADKGTVLRFIERPSSASKGLVVLPGFEKVEATFSTTPTYNPAFCDHWVSNVFSREGFIATLEDTLCFTPQVEFNAGVVAAGEARIESTVTGNSSSLKTNDKLVGLRDQSQIYLPINNALSPVGHVHWFLEQMGQGVQHIASRVEDILDMIQLTNDIRESTGEGFTFLNIPRSYYGILDATLMQAEGIEEALIAPLLKALEDGKVINPAGVVGDLKVTDEEIQAACKEVEGYSAHSELIHKTIRHSRYGNLYKLLGDHVTEANYVAIVRNKILVDVQGEDLLFQIFTANILQRKAGEEAPFLEFIQRACSCQLTADGECLPMKPGCGGFGIRNFLTLFLSIEVSKAMSDKMNALERGDEDAARKAQKMVGLFTEQLTESNPILTGISDAMTMEGKLLDSAAVADEAGNVEKAEAFRKEAATWAGKKGEGNVLLQDCSARYNTLFKDLREQK